MVPILINKDVFEPSYNDLKFTVRNHNYFFTNLYQMTSEKLLYITESSARSSVMAWSDGIGWGEPREGGNISMLLADSLYGIAETNTTW